VSLLNRVEEMVRGLLPQLERFEGTLRFNQSDAVDSPSMDEPVYAEPDNHAAKTDGVKGHGRNGDNGQHDDLPTPARTSTTSKAKR
jgi:hypothetical protein